MYINCTVYRTVLIWRQGAWMQIILLSSVYFILYILYAIAQYVPRYNNLLWNVHLPLLWTMLHILNQVYPLCALPDDGYVYQPKHVRITFIFVYTSVIQ